MHKNIPFDESPENANLLLQEKINFLQKALIKEISIEDKDLFLFFLDIAQKIICRDHRLLTFYRKEYRSNNFQNQLNLESSSNQARLKNDFEIEIIRLFTNSFINIMSALEYCLKDILTKKLPVIAERIDRYSTLRNIVKELEKENIISQESSNLWHGLIFFRNALVHNNTYAIRTNTYKFSEKVILKLVEDKPIKSHIKQTIFFIEWITNEYYNLVRKIFNILIA
ncbi:hypothetical protein P256_00083 [Acinetobacter nectaris CIP 110549]|uniref:Cthe-2314-like HEPN domain-containing protein n=1 Tax=Acinetobacter nectaris CIP 110549 TaxID=1392540 RepID=V2TGA8_9GAMM|nr:hypothetical protein [Acinetobacter nectaris]ESK41098.1 hypothetical protein P256_00083 [Acinetobacter nectaris CIP 110549]